LNLVCWILFNIGNTQQARAALTSWLFIYFLCVCLNQTHVLYHNGARAIQEHKNG